MEGAALREVRVSKINEIAKITRLKAIQSCRRMAGETQPQLMRANDGNLYVVKFQNNPQGVKILANELLGALLAMMLDLPIAPVAVIEVSETMVSLSECMSIRIVHSDVPCQPGLCFGAQFRLDGRFWPPDLITPEAMVNAADFAGMLVFDKWTGNADGRQVALVPTDDHSGYRAIMIDQGLCFYGDAWTFHDASLQGVAHFPRIYEQVRSLDDFEPWLTRLEEGISLEMLRYAADAIPPEWYRYREDALNELIRHLNHRRKLVRTMVRETLEVVRDYFRNVPVADMAVARLRSVRSVAKGT